MTKISVPDRYHPHPSIRMTTPNSLHLHRISGPIWVDADGIPRALYSLIPVHARQDLLDFLYQG